ncbi:6-phosphogluconolactonase [Algoriphagus boseongensis]|uniref:6-phosphogluconolactonase n=1 Tax=Algoriphagus boseongensis TaxID=1442587 RepID=A0A4R6T8D1_9BACT|nr:6-phosphogluconolactonase [Algoriphagus boseongensis]TDQ18966.1 6-phosphogluconolactonase [Algoriphagus boseongensis]
MKTEIYSTADEVAQKAAEYLEAKIRETINTKGSFSMAISGGRTPWEMLKILSKAHLRWTKVNIFQVDERIAPDGHLDRNLTQLFKSIEGSGIVTKVNIFPMHVISEDPEEACLDYAKTILEITGDGILDLVHLGMGADGHTASLVPGDKVCEIKDQNVAITFDPYQGRKRMTLTYPLINQAREILWVITGEEKAEMVERLLNEDYSIPAGKVNQENALALLDQPAAKLIG